MAKDQEFDVVIIGAGPAGLFAALEMTKRKPSARVGVVDLGLLLANRFCPLVETGKCPRCHVCHIAHGSGGAGMYSDGKLAVYPAGSGLVEMLGDVELVTNRCNIYLTF